MQEIAMREIQISLSVCHGQIVMMCQYVKNLLKLLDINGKRNFDVFLIDFINIITPQQEAMQRELERVENYISKVGGRHIAQVTENIGNAYEHVIHRKVASNSMLDNIINRLKPHMQKLALARQALDASEGDDSIEGLKTIISGLLSEWERVKGTV